MYYGLREKKNLTNDCEHKVQIMYISNIFKTRGKK